MDEIDIMILDILSNNSRATVSEISKKVNLSVPAVSERIKRLEKSNIIEKYTIKINRQKFGYKLLAIILISIDQTSNILKFRETILKFTEVIECYHIAGEYDYILKVLVNDTNELEEFLSNKLKTIKGVYKSNTLIILKDLKEIWNRLETNKWF